MHKEVQIKHDLMTRKCKYKCGDVLLPEQIKLQTVSSDLYDLYMWCACWEKWCWVFPGHDM